MLSVASGNITHKEGKTTQMQLVEPCPSHVALNAVAQLVRPLPFPASHGVGWTARRNSCCTSSHTRSASCQTRWLDTNLSPMAPVFGDKGLEAQHEMMCCTACCDSAEAVHNGLYQGCICVRPFSKVVDPAQLGLKIAKVLFHVLQNILR